MHYVSFIMIRTKHIIFIALVLIGFASCNPYQKLLKSGDYNLKYQKAVEYYEKGDYYRAQALFDEVVSIFKGTEKAEDIAYYYADCHYKQHDYTLASYYFETFAQNFPYSPRTPEASYIAAYCYYLNSPRYSLDQKDTYKAIESMQAFINKYPQSELIPEANLYIKELRVKLEQKACENAKLYFKLGDYQAASITLKNSIKDFPDTKYREELLYLSVKATYLLAENSISSKQGERYQSTVSEYYVFIDEFPESKYLKEVEKMYVKSVSQIKNL